MTKYIVTYQVHHRGSSPYLNTAIIPGSVEDFFLDLQKVAKEDKTAISIVYVYKLEQE